VAFEVVGEVVRFEVGRAGFGSTVSSACRGRAVTLADLGSPENDRQGSRRRLKAQLRCACAKGEDRRQHHRPRRPSPRGASPAQAVSGNTLATLEHRAPPIATKTDTDVAKAILRLTSCAARDSVSLAAAPSCPRAPAARARRPFRRRAHALGELRGQRAVRASISTEMEDRRHRNRAVPRRRRQFANATEASRTSTHQTPGELPFRLRATLAAVSKRSAAHACASHARAFAASCRFASAASTVNRVPFGQTVAACTPASRSPS